MMRRMAEYKKLMMLLILETLSKHKPKRIQISPQLLTL
jgi:hypothetical protein